MEHQLTSLTAVDSLNLADPFCSIIQVFRDVTEQDTELYVLVQQRLDQTLVSSPTSATYRQKLMISRLGDDAPSIQQLHTSSAFL